MREGAEELHSCVLVPGVYQVFLHDQDLRRFAPIAKRIGDEAELALSESLRKLNEQPMIVGFLTGKRPLYQCADNAWKIELLADPDDELQVNSVRVRSQMVRPTHGNVHGGAPTRFTVTDFVAGVEKPAPPAQPCPESGAQRVLAEFRLQFEGNWTTYHMRKQEFVIGRKGPNSVADLQLENQHVSMVHLRVRRNPLGEFMLENLGRFGTTVNHRPVARNSEVALPKSALIGLGNDTSIIEFEAMG